MDLLKDLEGLVVAFGKEKVTAAVEALLQTELTQTKEVKVDPLVVTVSPELAELQKRRPLDIPAEWLFLVSPDILADTINQLDGTGRGLVEAGNSKALASSGKGALLKEKRTMETAIKLTEAEVLMRIQGTGKDAFVILGDQRYSVGTEQLKDACRRLASKTRREELARIEGDIMKMDGDAIAKNDDWNTAKEAAENARARAFLQGHILAYMAPRG